MRRRKTGGRGGRIQGPKGLKPRSAPKATRHRSSVASEEETNAAQFRRARDEALKRLAATDFSKRVKELLKLGPRETGSPAHGRFIDQIAREIESLGLPVYRDSYRFSRWSLSDPSSDCELKVAGQNVLVASAYPYSGVTGPEGVTGRLTLAGCCPWKMNGKIAVFDVPYPKVPIRLLVDDLERLGDGDFPRTIAHPVLAATAFGPDLAAAKAAGAIGAVAVWRKDTAWPRDGDMTRELAADQYVPFIFPYRDIPAVWVAGEKEGEQLLEDARRGAVATLKLNASLSPGTLTDTVWTVVKGEITNESILVVTHTDGVNVVEENGPIGVLALARMFTDGPEPKRTLVFVFVTGHLRIPAVTSYGQATTAWLTAHPEWWSGKNGAPRAVAGLVIEHLGARPADGIPELAYATNSTMRSVLEKWEKANRTKGLAVIARPRLLEIGEGEPLYQHDIPAISLASVPDDLLATTNTDVNIELMHEQIITFAEALLSLEIKSANEIGRIKRAALLKTLSTWLQLALFIGRDKTLRSHVLHAACFKLTSWTICAFRRLVRWSKEKLRLE